MLLGTVPIGQHGFQPLPITRPELDLDLDAHAPERTARPGPWEPSVSFRPLAAPEIGVPVAVDDGIFWLRVRLPLALDHVNLWLCDDGDGWTVVDTGYGDAPTRQLWQSLLAGKLAGRPVRRVLVTHFHPDHAGQAGWLCAVTDAALWMSRTEWLMHRALAFDATAASVAATERCYRRAALPEEIVARQVRRGNAYRQVVSEPPGAFTRIAAGQSLTMAGSAWCVLIGQGHAPEQVTLWCAERNLLIAADQILPRISPVIGAWPSEPDADPLHEFLTSLAQYRDLPDGCRVLPSHGLPFDGLHERLTLLAAHHAERLERTLEACAAPATAATILNTLFQRPLDAHQMGFALAETLAHLNHLLNRGQIGRTPDGAGVLLYEGC
jgi:glyoxylase-like metal-dependent hydrolase (beta-lactamase superfamily II)